MTQRIKQCRFWKELINSDATIYGGSGVGNKGGAMTISHGTDNGQHVLELTLPPLGVLFLKHVPEEKEEIIESNDVSQPITEQ